MKTFKIYLTMLLAVFMLGSTFTEAQAQTEPKKGWSKKAKGAAIGGGAGVVGGAVVGGTKGAVIGGVAGAAAGGLIGRKKDKKKDPVRHAEYTKKD
ncbi:glycine zipper domain-containing protein [Hymenobacter lucidus]|uniref:YMGG-like glycine zipper-containing protein n=1 Tax=Hymenobacter lucidus TaxID=2880930 RepID=A0ABS8AW97_9BACT|nr:YMGG-like glycine zipper-containing protein [Hymenobacter lucidus]MCB2409791.1 YMGG-like glycine zipper-containing protein [Hymenobacter lucidus]